MTVPLFSPAKPLTALLPNKTEGDLLRPEYVASLVDHYVYVDNDKETMDALLDTIDLDLKSEYCCIRFDLTSVNSFI